MPRGVVVFPEALTQRTFFFSALGLYAVNDYVATSGTNSSIAVTGYLEQYIAASDLAAFFTAYDPTHARTATIIGPNDQTNPGTEASLDIQYSMGVAPGIPGTFWYTAGRQPNSTENEPFLDFLMTLASTDPAPWVVSTSYGDDEPTVDFGQHTRTHAHGRKQRGSRIACNKGWTDRHAIHFNIELSTICVHCEEHSCVRVLLAVHWLTLCVRLFVLLVSAGYASRMNVEFQKLGARGISILFSSGDGGVSGGQSQQCTNFIPT